MKILKYITISTFLLVSFQAKAFETLQQLVVTATAYNSLPEQTDDTPNIAAWNNVITPGDKIIAVSRDLLPLGLTNGVKVKIIGIDGLFTVRDKMNKRWKKKIDIYMGVDKSKALKWGKRKVAIIWKRNSKQSLIKAKQKLASN